MILRRDFDRVWFTADHHFEHANIIKYCNRPFDNLEEMEEALIQGWNDRVGPDDTVYHLGDLCMGFKGPDYLGSLNGNIHILRVDWHHDKRWLNAMQVRPVSKSEHPVFFLSALQVVYAEHPDTEFWRHGVPITLSHYPLAEWERSHHGALQLHGHSHGKYHDPLGNILDVGVDNCNYQPINMFEVINRMRTRHLMAGSYLDGYGFA